MQNRTNMIPSEAKKMMFTITNCFIYDNSPEDQRCIELLVDYFTTKGSNMGFYGAGKLCRYIFEYSPQANSFVKFILEDDPSLQGMELNNIPIISPSEIPCSVEAVFLCATSWHSLTRMKKRLPQHVETITLEVLKEINWEAIPNRAWVPEVDSIYPIDIPDIKFIPDQDMILLDVPARSIAQMPAGFAYVHNALKKTGVKFQTIDLDIIIYHRYHSHRILDGMAELTTPGGYILPEDPWQPVHYLDWEKPDVIEYFRSDINEIVEGLIQARPKIIGLSLQQVSISFAREVVKGVRKGLSDVVILVGGMSCYRPEAAKIVFPEADYTIIGEADLIVGPLVELLAKGEKPYDMPGVLSRYDSPNRVFVPGPLPHDLDSLDFPHYEWTNVHLYRNWNGYHLVPIVGSRGCIWSRCRFCAERFQWRTRSPENIAGELEWLAKQGCETFVFNESDLHGDPKLILQLCDEIIKRNLKLNITAQLRCHKQTDREYYKKLRSAGFRCLRFGVDAWSENTLRLQLKGYTKDIITQNLEAASKAGISIETNLVIGVPGEREEDIDETIDLIVQNKPYIWRVAFISPFMLLRGSCYWEEPEKYNIVFRGNKDEAYNKCPVEIYDLEWYSTDPYIDAEIRYKRFMKVVLALQKQNVNIGDFADFIKEQVEHKMEQLADIYNGPNKTGDSLLTETLEAVSRTDSSDDNTPLSKAEKAKNICSYENRLFYSIFKDNGEFYGIPAHEQTHPCLSEEKLD